VQSEVDIISNDIERGDNDILASWQGLMRFESRDRPAFSRYFNAIHRLVKTLLVDDAVERHLIAASCLHLSASTSTQVAALRLRDRDSASVHQHPRLPLSQHCECEPCDMFGRDLPI
jgi:hypothetical protein